MSYHGLLVRIINPQGALLFNKDKGSLGRHANFLVIFRWDIWVQRLLGSFIVVVHVQSTLYKVAADFRLGEPF